MAEVERIGIEATLGLAEQTVHLVRVRVRGGVRIWVRCADRVRPCTFVVRKAAQPVSSAS